MIQPNAQIAKLALEDGTVFTGRNFGASATRAGEVVFNTSMAGYQEILTDPSYAGQIVTMTYPLIGNYGVTDEDAESARPQVEGFIVKELSPVVSNFRASGSLADYLARWGVVAIEGIDTRALVRKLRLAGVMRGVLSIEILDDAELVRRARAIPNMAGRDLVRVVKPAAPYDWRCGFESPFAGPRRAGDFGLRIPALQALPLAAGTPAQATGLETAEIRNPKSEIFSVVAIDCGAKRNILRNLVEVGCRVAVLPPDTPPEKVLELAPDGLFLSNGPGDPEPVAYTINLVKALLGRVPIFGICLGCQLLGLAMGARTFKLKFGHRGGNQPVMNLTTGRVEITSQNHGFAVEPEGLAKVGGVLTHVNLNDRTLEGFMHRELPAFAVQYHPEASPGPHDASYLFDCFVEQMRTGRPPTAETMAAAQDRLK